jgi:acetolactate synthase I/II/III large subunit
LNKHDLVQPANSAPALRSGGEILVSGLRLNGVDRMFGVPGESALPIFDALVGARPGIRFIACRHEATASHMAEADGKISGRPGICVVSRGPGAMHAAIGLHTAWQDSTPMIMIIGQVPRRHRGREAFQEINYTRTFDDMTKWVGEVESPDQIPEFVSRAFHVALQGRPGPVVLSLPEDVLSAMSDVADAAPAKIAEAGPSDAQMLQLERLLRGAQRPMIIVGNLGWTPTAAEQFNAFVTRNDIPVIAGFRSQDVLDNRSPQYVGDLSLGCSRALMERVKAADLLLVIGDRLGDVTTNHFSLLEVPTPKQVLAHVFPGAEELGRIYIPTLAIQSKSSTFVNVLATLPTLDPKPWAAWRTKGRPTPWSPIRRGALMARALICPRSSRILTIIWPTTPSSPTAPATIRSGCIDSIVIGSSALRLRRSPDPWATACQPRSRQSCVTLIARSSAWPAMVAL